MSLARTIVARLSRLLPITLKSRLKWTLMIPDMEASMRNMARLGFRPRHALDIGAFAGDWAKTCQRVFPGAQVMMVEPQPHHGAALRQLCQSTAGLTLTQALLGREPREAVAFRLIETGSSMFATDRHPDARTIELPMTTLEQATRGTPFARPELIKIDVQGAELEVFEGGWEVVTAAQALIVEVSLFQEYEDSPLMPAMISTLSRRGFRPYDICTIWRNTPGQAAVQADIIFAREDSPLFDKRHYIG